jgi:hypothetical protein
MGFFSFKFHPFLLFSLPKITPRGRKNSLKGVRVNFCGSESIDFKQRGKVMIFGVRMN